MSIIYDLCWNSSDTTELLQSQNELGDRIDRLNAAIIYLPIINASFCNIYPTTFELLIYPDNHSTSSATSFYFGGRGSYGTAV